MKRVILGLFASLLSLDGYQSTPLISSHHENIPLDNTANIKFQKARNEPFQKGDLLIEYDTSSLIKDINRAEALRDKYKADFKIKTEQYQAMLISDSSLKEVYAELEKHQNILDTLNKDLLSAKILAPFAGEVIKANKDSLEIASTNELEAHFTIEIKDLSKVEENHPIKIFIPELNKNFRGIISAIYKRNNPEVVVLIQNPDKELATGMTARINLYIPQNNVNSFVGQLSHQNYGTLPIETRTGRLLSQGDFIEINFGTLPVDLKIANIAFQGHIDEINAGSIPVQLQSYALDYEGRIDEVNAGSIPVQPQNYTLAYEGRIDEINAGSIPVQLQPYALAYEGRIDEINAGSIPVQPQVQIVAYQGQINAIGTGTLPDNTITDDIAMREPSEVARKYVNIPENPLPTYLRSGRAKLLKNFWIE